MAAKKFPAMARVGMTSRLAGPASDQISQLRSQLPSQLPSQIPSQIPSQVPYPVKSSQ